MNSRFIVQGGGHEGVIFRVFTWLVVLSLPFGVTNGCSAPGEFPSRPIEIVSPYPPGGTTDRNAQALLTVAEKHLGQPLVLVYKSGGGGSIGATYVANSPPDGYRLFLSSPGDTTVIPNVARVAYSFRSFKAIARISRSPYVLATQADAPWSDLDQFVDHARQHPGQLTVATLASGALVRMGMEMFHQRAGITLTQVPYTGFGPTTAALLGGHVDVAETVVPSVMPHVEAGKTRILALSGPSRVKELPDVPTFNELGFDVPFTVWIGVSAPAGILPQRLDFLRKAFQQLIKDPEFVASAAKLDVTTAYATGEELDSWIEQEDALVKSLLK